MSVVGIDFGNLNCVVSVARKRGIDVIANEASRRETPTLVAFRDTQRYLGEQAATQMMSNLQNTISDLKLLIGRKYSQKEVQSLIETLPFRVKQMDGDNIGIQVTYQDQQQIFSVEQVTAMMFTQLRKMVEADSKNTIKVQEVVISVPSYFTDAQRRALKDAAEIAGLNCHQLLAEPTALATPYGMYKKDLPEDSDPMNVMFVNFGHATITASVVAFSKSTVRVLSSAADEIGGRDFDQCLFDHVNQIIKSEFKLDISENKRAKLRVLAQCEKVKRVLTGNAEALFYCESLMNDIDVRAMVKREDFESLIQPVLERVSVTVDRAIKEANLSKPLNAVEVVGGSSYVPAFQTHLQKITGLELSHTQNKYESVSRGCALQCAVISPQFHINRNVTIKDYIPYTISITWTEVATGEKKSAVLFKKGDAAPTAKRITFKKSNLEISADYSNPDELPPSTPTTHIGKFYIPKFENTIDNAESTQFEVKFKIDGSGIFSMDYARAVETYYEIEKPAETPQTTSDKPAPAGENGASESPSTNEQTPAENPPAAEANKDAEGDTVMQEPKKKKKSKSTNLIVTATLASGLPRDLIRNLASKESAMEAADTLAIATAEARNALESYAYDSQSKLQYDFSEWTPFASEEEKSKLMSSIDEIITWLYGEGDNADKQTYDSKLNNLKTLGDPLDQRRIEEENRPAAIEQLKQSLQVYENFLASNDEKYAHIEEEDRKKIRDKIQEVSDWLAKMQEKQTALPKTENPVLVCSALDQKKGELERFCNPIINKPKPKPKVEEKPKEEPNTDPATDQSANAPPQEGTSKDGPTVEEVKDDIPAQEPLPDDMDVD